MATKLVGLKDFRQNLASYSQEAQRKKVRFIVLKKNIPFLEVKGIDEKEFLLEKLAEDIKESRKQAKQGKVYTQEEVMKEFGLL